MSAADSLATSETISDPSDDEALELVDDDVALDAVDALDTLDEELDDSSAASRLARSASSDDSRLLALELDELESLALETPGGGPDGGGPGGGPPAPSTPLEALLAEFSPLLEETPPSCDRKASTAADSPTAVEASDVETVLLADADVEALALVVSEELFWLARLAWSSRNNCDWELKPEMDIDMVCPQTLPQELTPITLRNG